MRSYDLNQLEINTVVDFFLYHLKVEERQKFMKNYPQLYNKLIGREIMKVKLTKHDFIQDSAVYPG